VEIGAKISLLFSCLQAAHLSDREHLRSRPPQRGAFSADARRLSVSEVRFGQRSIEATAECAASRQQPTAKAGMPVSSDKKKDSPHGLPSNVSHCLDEPEET